MPTFTQLQYEIIGHVAVLSMNNAPVNALSRTLSDEITEALDYISEIPGIRAVVLTGIGKISCDSRLHQARHRGHQWPSTGCGLGDCGFSRYVDHV